MGSPGDRTDEIIRGVAELAARGTDQVAIAHKEHYLRGRELSELTALLREGAAAVGVTDVPDYPTELAALQALVAEASPGDAVGVMCHAQRSEIGAWLAAAGATVDGPDAIRRKVLRVRGA
jgi:cyanophycin synthetase